MCGVTKQFELLKFVFDSVYVDLQYDEISLTFTAGSVCEVVMVPYVVGARAKAMLVWGQGRCGCGECIYGWYTCVCVWLGAGGVGVEWIGFGLYQFGRNVGKVGYVSVFWEGGLGQGVWCDVCVCCESGLFVLMAGPDICILC